MYTHRLGTLGRTKQSTCGIWTQHGRCLDVPAARHANKQRALHVTRATSTVSSRPVDSRLRASELYALLQEASSLAIATGPKGIARAFQGASAVASLAQDYLRTGTIDEPQVLLRKLFERLGATYIKLGQFIASSPSLFPDEYVLEFQKCLDQTDPVPYSTIEKIIEEELKRPWREVFSSIDTKPLASASVAQVHAAVLKDSGKEVVLKVLKPGVEDILTADLNFVYLASRVLEFIQPDLSRLSVSAVLQDIRNSMIGEVDFTREAAHVAQFSAFLDANRYRGVATCPFVYTAISSRRLMVMERMVGVPLVDMAAIRSVTNRDPESVLINALNTWFASVMMCETFHADVHAGNLLVLRDGRVAFIDFGIVGKISPVTWKAVQILASSLAVADYEQMARALATIGACDEDVDFNSFARDLEGFFVELEQVNTQLVVGVEQGSARLGATVQVDSGQLNRLVLDLVRIGEKHGIRFPREFGMFLKQLLYFDRYTRILAPSLQVFNDERVNVRRLSNTYSARI